MKKKRNKTKKRTVFVGRSAQSIKYYSYMKTKNENYLTVWYVDTKYVNKKKLNHNNNKVIRNKNR